MHFYFKPYNKKTSKWIKDLSRRCTTIKAQTTKEKQITWAFPKLKLLCTQEQNQQSEKASHGMGKVVANYISDKGLISTIYKEIL